MRIYIAGPMSGYKDFNFPAFFAAEEEVRKTLDDGALLIFNPARKDLEMHRKEVFENETGDVAESEAKGFSLRKAMKWDMEKICECDAIYMLKGWEHSSGARTEWSLANCLRLQIIYQ